MKDLIQNLALLNTTTLLIPLIYLKIKYDRTKLDNLLIP